jgi:hypothetical protein
MELPDDVLRLVREYAKPCFKYFREYKRTLALMGLHTLPKLKTCLLLDPARILGALVDYAQAHLAFQVSLNEFTHYAKTTIDYSKQMKVFRTRGDLFDAKIVVLRLIQ